MQPPPPSTTRPMPPAPITGIVDVHHDDGAVDMAAAARGGVVALVHKLTEGRDWIDPKAVERLSRARAAGLLVGVYHYGNATDPEQQADHFIAHASAHPDALWALDCENNGRSRFGTMRPEQAAAFVSHVHRCMGRWPVFYSFTSFLRGWGTLDTATRAVLSKCALWQAQYGEKPTKPANDAWSTIALWQYTNGADGPNNRGTYPRITPGFARAAQDRSAFDGTLDELRAWWTTCGRGLA